MPFDYFSWQQDHQLPPDDEDFEWNAHVIVLAGSPEAAQAWGDHLIGKLCSHSKDLFLRSSVEPHVCGTTVRPGKHHSCPNFPKPSGDGYFESPVVVDGEDASAEYIGW